MSWLPPTLLIVLTPSITHHPRLNSIRKSNARVSSALPGSLLVDRAAALNKPPVVLDIGRAYTKCGFAGEPAPRAIFPTPATFWDHVADPLPVARSLMTKVFFEHLLVNPKERRVVLCDDYMQSDMWREAVLHIVLVELGAVSAALLPAPTLALLPLGLDTALIIDAGARELRVMPVEFGVPLVQGWMSAPLGAAAVKAELRAVLPALDNTAAEDVLQRLCSVVAPASAGVCVIRSCVLE